jgi:hypothetical protein
MEGYKTYTGLAIALIGLLLSGYLDKNETEVLATSIVQLVGIGFAIYGRYKAK